MELDNLKQSMTKNLEDGVQVPSLNKIDNDTQQYKSRYKLHVWLETSVAVLALFFIVVALYCGEVWYPILIAELLPSLVNDKLSIHPLMYLAMIAMVCYSVFVPIKLHRAKNQEQAMLTWTVKQRIEAEIEHFEKLKNLWSGANLWSFMPAMFIGVTFFWGLQVSLIGRWFPTVYLFGYFVFVGLSLWSGLKMKKQVIENEITPILKDLYLCKHDLAD